MVEARSVLDNRYNDNPAHTMYADADGGTLGYQVLRVAAIYLVTPVLNQWEEQTTDQGIDHNHLIHWACVCASLKPP